MFQHEDRVVKLNTFNLFSLFGNKISKNQVATTCSNRAMQGLGCHSAELDIQMIPNVSKSFDSCFISHLDITSCLIVARIVAVEHRGLQQPSSRSEYAAEETKFIFSWRMSKMSV